MSCSASSFARSRRSRRASSSRCWDSSTPAPAPPASARCISARRAWASRSTDSARRSALWRASSSWPGRPRATRSSSSMRSIADSRRATTAAASSRSATELPWMPGSILVRRSSTSASASALAASRRASSASTHGVALSGRNTTSVPAVRQPSQGWASGSSAWRSARTTTGCCARMRCSIRFMGSSKPRSSRKSEKSKPSSSLTGTNTASIGNALPSACTPETSTRPGPEGGSPASRKPRHDSAAAGTGACTSRSKKDCPSTSAAGRPNSSSAGSDHLDTDPWPSVSTKYPPTIWRRIGSSGSSDAISAPFAIASSAVRSRPAADDGTPWLLVVEGSTPHLSAGGRRTFNHSSRRTAAARESSAAVPPACSARDVVNRSS